MTKSQRLHHLLQYLLASRHPIPSQRLAEEFNVSSQTIKRDLDELIHQQLMPIEYQRERNGWLFIGDRGKFQGPALGFREDELLALLSTSALFETLQPGLLTRQLGPLRKRIEALIEQTGHRVADISQRVLLKSPARRKIHQDSFDTLVSALLERRAVQIRYHSRSTDRHSQRTLHPARLLHYRDNWHLIALCEQAGALRNFSLDRIQAVEPSDHLILEPDPQDLQRELQAAFGIFGGQPIAEADLLFTPHRARWIADESWHPDQRGEWTTQGYRLRVPYASPIEITQEILRLGAEVKVLGPPDLRQEVARQLRLAADQYRDQG